MGARIESQGTAHGLSWACLIMDVGHRCGYVRIPDGHPLNGLGYAAPAPGADWKDLEEVKIGKRGVISLFCSSRDEAPRLDVMFDVHGSLTFAGGLEHCGLAPGWWLGFDCNHAGDAQDRELMSGQYREMADRYGSCCGGVVRSREYVERECVNLAAQIVACYPLAVEGAQE